MMELIKKKLPGILTCFIIAVPSWLLGKTFPIIGGPVIAILAGMLITMVWKIREMQRLVLNGHPRLFFRLRLYCLDLE